MGCFDQVLEKITLRLSKKLCQVPKNNSQYWVKNNGNFHYFLLSAENYFLKIHCFLGIFTQRKIMVLHDQDRNAYRMLGQAKSTALFYASLFILFQLVKVQFCSTSNQYCQFLLPLPFFSIQSSCVALMPKCFYYSTKLLFTLFKHQQGPLQ